MTDVDRAALLELLDRLGSDDDATVLSAARELHRKIAESGISWDELVRLDRGGNEPVSEDAENEGAAPVSPDDGEAARLIERLLRKGVSDDLCDDLSEMKRQLAEGSLDPDDRSYLSALAKRLGA